MSYNRFTPDRIVRQNKIMDILYFVGVCYKHMNNRDSVWIEALKVVEFSFSQSLEIRHVYSFISLLTSLIIE